LPAMASISGVSAGTSAMNWAALSRRGSLL
jgi:hypothetical protein